MTHPIYFSRSVLRPGFTGAFSFPTQPSGATHAPHTMPALTHLNATLTNHPTSVDSKQLTGNLNPSESTLTKNRGERLSVLSSGKRGEFVSYLARFGVQPNEKFMSQSNADDLFGFSRCGQTLVEGSKVGVIATNHSGDHEQDGAHVPTSAAYHTFALVFPAVAGQRRQTCQFGNCFVGRGADLGHLGHQPRHGTVGYTLDGAKSLIQFLPQRIGGDQRSNGRFQGADLGSHQRQHLAERAQHHGFTDQKTLVALGSLQLGELAQPGDQGFKPLLFSGKRSTGSDPF